MAAISRGVVVHPGKTPLSAASLAPLIACVLTDVSALMQRKQAAGKSFNEAAEIRAYFAEKKEKGRQRCNAIGQ